MSDPQRAEREAIEQALRQVWTILGNATLPASDVVRRAFKIADTALLALPVSVEPRDGTKGDCIYCMKPGHVYRHSGGYNWSMCDACRDSSAALQPTPTECPVCLETPRCGCGPHGTHRPVSPQSVREAHAERLRSFIRAQAPGGCRVLSGECECLLCGVDVLLSAPTPTPGWQPMDTAPKDGTWVLTVDSRGTQTVTKYVRRFNDIESWIDAHNYEHGTSAWQPLPPAPTGDRS